MARSFALIALIATLGGGGCSSGDEQSSVEAEQAKKPAQQVRDETHRFHKDGLVEAKVVLENLGGKEFMPGGNYAEYEKDGKKYQVFFTLRGNAEQAMFLSMDYRDALGEMQFIPHFGGFFGMDGETPTLVFQKNKYVIAIAGLELDDADQAGRMIAGYLN